MKNIRIKYSSNWADPISLADRVKRNWGDPPEGMEVVTNGEFDFLVSFNFSPEMFTIPKEKNIVFTMEPNWSMGIKSEIIDHSFKVFSSVDRFADKENVEMIPCLMFLHDSGGSTTSQTRRVEKDVNITMENYLNNDSFDKSKKCSIILAAHKGISPSYNHAEAMYQHREKLLAGIVKSDLDIDIYGRNWIINDTRFKGQAEYKEDALKDYEFSIALENSKENYYLSEKLIDCFVYNCVPIYDGCNLTHKFYNPLSFEEIDSTSDSVIEDIRKILNGTNGKYKKFVLESKDKYFKDYNIYTYLRRCIYESK